MVLHGQIITQVGRQIIKGITRYYKLEGKAFNKLYTGFPRSKTIGRGVRHGLTAGSIAGSLISNDEEQMNGGFQKSRNGLTSSPSYQARSRFSGRNRSGYRNRYSNYSKCRCPSPGKYRRSRNRFES